MSPLFFFLSDHQKLEREARICRLLKHPNIGEPRVLELEKYAHRYKPIRTQFAQVSCESRCGDSSSRHSYEEEEEESERGTRSVCVHLMMMYLCAPPTKSSERQQGALCPLSKAVTLHTLTSSLFFQQSSSLLGRSFHPYLPMLLFQSAAQHFLLTSLFDAYEVCKYL